jgi:hypothetical protein
VYGDELSDEERAILAFERQRWKYAAAKESAILTQFGMSGTRYYRVLNGLLDQPATVAYDPVLVNRLRRLREARRRQRIPRG